MKRKGAVLIKELLLFLCSPGTRTCTDQIYTSQKYPTARSFTPKDILIPEAVLRYAFNGCSITFAVYPALRPFSDEASLQGAAAFASVEWLVAHLIAILAFILLTFGLYGVYVSLRKTSAERTAFYGLVLSWLGTGLTLPFYGAEVFGLHVIGKETISAIPLTYPMSSMI